MATKLVGQAHVHGHRQHSFGNLKTVSASGCTGPGTYLSAAPARWAGQRRRFGKHAASAADWNYASPSSGADWAMAQGAYSDPRAPGPGARRRPGPAPERPSDGPSTSTDGRQSAQDSDPLSEMARMVVDGVTSFLSSAVGVLSDWLLSLLPSTVKRRAVENSVKGGLVLLGLALLQSVLSLVLTVGTLVLVVYTAHQVFGVHLPFLSGTADVERGGVGTDGMPGHPGAAPPDPRYYSGTTAQPNAGYGPHHQQQGYGGYYGPATGYGGRGQPYPPRPGAAGGGGWGPGPRAAGQGPVIDVFYESP